MGDAFNLPSGKKKNVVQDISGILEGETVGF